MHTEGASSGRASGVKSLYRNELPIRQFTLDSISAMKYRAAEVGATNPTAVFSGARRRPCLGSSSYRYTPAGGKVYGRNGAVDRGPRTTATGDRRSTAARPLPPWRPVSCNRSASLEVVRRSHTSSRSTTAAGVERVRRCDTEIRSEAKSRSSVSPQVRRRPTDRGADASVRRVRRTRSMPATATTSAPRHDCDHDFPPTKEPTVSRSRDGRSDEKTHPSERTSSQRLLQTSTTMEPTIRSRGRSPEKTKPVKIPPEKSRSPAKRASERKRSPCILPRVQRRPADRGSDATSAIRARRAVSMPETPKTPLASHRDKDADIPQTPVMTEPGSLSRGRSPVKTNPVKSSSKKTHLPVRSSSLRMPQTSTTMEPINRSCEESPENMQTVKRPSETTEQLERRPPLRRPRTSPTTEPTDRSRGESPEKNQPVKRPPEKIRIPVRTFPHKLTTLGGIESPGMTHFTRIPPEKSHPSVRTSSQRGPQTSSTMEPTISSRGRSPEKTKPAKRPPEKSHSPAKTSPPGVSRASPVIKPTNRSRGGSPEKTKPAKTPPEKTHSPVRTSPPKVRQTSPITKATICSRGRSPEKIQPMKRFSEKTQLPIRTSPPRVPRTPLVPPTIESTNHSRGRSPVKTQLVKRSQEKTRSPVKRSPSAMSRTSTTTAPNSRSRGGSLENTKPIKTPSEKAHQPARRSLARGTRTPPTTEPTNRSRGQSPMVKNAQSMEMPSENTQVPRPISAADSTKDSMPTSSGVTALQVSLKSAWNKLSKAGGSTVTLGSLLFLAVLLSIVTAAVVVYTYGNGSPC